MPRCEHPHRVFITGGTGQIGSCLIPLLLERGHKVRALVRPGSKANLPAGCEVVSGNPLDANTYRNLIRPADTFVQLVGVAHPSPSKGAQFRAIDLKSAQEAITAAAQLNLSHFIYLSVAQPAPIMKDYVAARAECEALIRERGLNATILRPWYVLGPGRRWPYVLLPFYRMMEMFPPTRAVALRLGLVTLDQMVLALAQAVESPAQGVCVVTVPEIRVAQISAIPAQTARSA